MLKRFGSIRGSGYLLAALAVGVASLLPYPLAKVLGSSAPLMPFTLAILFSAWYGGLGPGLFATAAGFIIADLVYTEPQFSFYVRSQPEAIRLLLFTIVGTLISFCCGSLHTTKRRAQEGWQLAHRKMRELEDEFAARRLAEQVQIRTEKRSQSVIAHVADGIVTIDQDGNIESCNAAAERIFGYAAKEIVGKNVKVLMPDSYSDEHESYIENYLRTGERKVIGIGREVAGLRKDGSTFPMDLSVSEFELDGRKFFTGIVRDITERKRAEAAIIESEKRFRLTADAAPVLIWMSGVDKLCTWFNKPWLDFTGRTMEQEVGNGWAWGVHPADYDRCLETYCSAFDARQPFNMQYRLKRHDGQYRWLLDIGVPLYAPDGAFCGYIGSCVDFTDQKLALDKSIDTEQKLQMALDAGRMGTWEWRIEANEIFWSPGVEKIHGLEPGAFPGTFDAFQEDIHPEDKDRVFAAISQVLKRGVDHHIEYRIILPDGSLHWVEARGKLERDEKGNPRRMHGICIEVTDRKRGEQELRFRAESDGLTKLANRRTFHERLQAAIRDCKRAKKPISLLLIDLDDFKKFNDEFGHLCGDKALQAVADILRRQETGSRVVARIGGDEFALILPGADEAEAEACAGAIAVAVEAYRWQHKPIRLTIGAATGEGPSAKESLLMAEADRQLYQGKRHRRTGKVKH